MFTPMDAQNFAVRLQKIIDHYELSASAFAEKIGVQRSSISHLLSGRNKASLDFVLKIINTFPEVDLYWLLLGIGNFPSTVNKNDSSFISEKTPIQKNVISKSKFIPKDLKKQIDRIVVFYNDGSFDEYQN